MKESTLKKFLRMPRFEEHLDLHRMDCQASHGRSDLLRFRAKRVASIPPEKMRPAPLVTGHDLIAAGYAPGPRFKEILSAVEDGQLEGRLQYERRSDGTCAREFPKLTSQSRRSFFDARRFVQASHGGGNQRLVRC